MNGQVLIEANVPVAAESCSSGQAAQTSTVGKRRLSFLDCVRGLSALSVAVYHIGYRAYPGARAFNHDKFNLGNFGVVAFFFVSGFVIPMSIEKHATLRSFWRGRFLRLYPMYWLSLGIAGLALFTGLLPAEGDLSSHLARTFIFNFTMLQGLFKQPDVLAVYWTLELEMVFYALCSLLFLIGLLRKSFSVSVIFSIVLLCGDLAAQFAAHRSLPVGHLGLLGAAFLGSVAYRVNKGQATRLQLACAGLLLYSVLLHGLWMRFKVYPEPRQMLAGTWEAYLTSWTCAFAFFFAFFALRQFRFPRVLTGLGKLTYSLYLLHAIVYWIIPIFLPRWIWASVVLSSSILLAWITYRLVEEPMMRRI